MTTEQNTAKDTVLGKIRAGQLSMRPKAHFVLATALAILLAATAFFLSAVLATVAVFYIRLNGHDALLSFGPRGALAFLELFPWLIVLPALALIIVLWFLLGRFRFWYRNPALYLLVALALALGAIAIAFDSSTNFHEHRFEEAERGELPEPFGDLYESARQRPPEHLGIFRGLVISVGEETFVMTYDDEDSDEDDGTWTVYPSEEIEVIEGDEVYVAGDEDDGVIRAYGIRILSR